jgi:DNA polymerase-3 subunit delta
MAAADPTVVLLHGEEQFLVDDEARRLLLAWRAPLVSDFGFEAVDPAGLAAPRLRDAVLQAPFLDEYRVVAVRGVASGRADSLAAALSEVPETTRLLLTVNGRLGAASKLAAAVKAAGGQVREHQRLRGRKVSDWAQARARELGVPAAAAAQLVAVTPPELAIVDAELRKLAGYQAGGGSLDGEAVRELLAGGREDDVFRLTDNLLPRPNGAAFTAVQSLLRSGANATTVGYRVARHLSLVLDVRARRDRGQTLEQVQAEMKEHPFVIQKAFDSAGAISPEQLEAGLRACLDYEWEVKSGQIEADAGLEVLLTKL